MLYVLMSSMMLGDVQCIYKARNTQTVVKSVLHDFEQKELTWIHVYRNITSTKGGIICFSIKNAGL